MTAEERYLRMLEDCDAKHATGPEAPCERCGVAAIRAAEDDALERAAKWFDSDAETNARIGKPDRVGTARWAAERVRSLKSGRTPGGGER